MEVTEVVMTEVVMVLEKVEEMAVVVTVLEEVKEMVVVEMGKEEVEGREEVVVVEETEVEKMKLEEEWLKVRLTSLQLTSYQRYNDFQPSTKSNMYPLDSRKTLLITFLMIQQGRRH